MIKLSSNGSYKLIETKRLNKILYLDSDAYVWVESVKIGHFLESTYRNHKAANILSEGRYNLYVVEDEFSLFDLQHLELEVGHNLWQGYLLLTGLPDIHKRKSRIIPTLEVISDNPIYSLRETNKVVQ
jgi:hypothetical protein